MYEFWQQHAAMQRLYIGFEITHSSFSRSKLGNAFSQKKGRALNTLPFL